MISMIIWRTFVCFFFYYLNPDKYALDSVFAFKVTSGNRVFRPDSTFEIKPIFLCLLKSDVHL